MKEADDQILIIHLCRCCFDIWWWWSWSSKYVWMKIGGRVKCGELMFSSSLLCQSSVFIISTLMHALHTHIMTATRQMAMILKLYLLLVACLLLYFIFSFNVLIVLVVILAVIASKRLMTFVCVAQLIWLLLLMLYSERGTWSSLSSFNISSHRVCDNIRLTSYTISLFFFFRALVKLKDNNKNNLNCSCCWI